MEKKINAVKLQREIRLKLGKKYLKTRDKERIAGVKRKICVLKEEKGRYALLITWYMAKIGTATIKKKLPSTAINRVFEANTQRQRFYITVHFFHP